MKVRLKLSDHVREKLRQSILDGTYKTGDRLPPEPELMELFKVGRSTIREAIRDLALAGMLRVQQGAGTTVMPPIANEPLDNRLRRADFDELNAVRKLLEKEIVALATLHHTPANLQELSDWLKKRRTAIEQEIRVDCMDADIGFHTAMATASGNRVLADLYGSFTNVIRNFFNNRESSGVSRFALSHHLHEELYHAIAAKDNARAQYVLQQILDNNY